MGLLLVVNKKGERGRFKSPRYLNRQPSSGGGSSWQPIACARAPPPRCPPPQETSSSSQVSHKGPAIDSEASCPTAAVSHENIPEMPIFKPPDFFSKEHLSHPKVAQGLLTSSVSRV